MSHRAHRISDAVQTYDYLLYAKADWDSIKIYRKCKEYRNDWLSFEVPLLVVQRNDHLVMSLTDTWGARGKKVDWGIEPIMARLKAMDLWNSHNVADEFFKNEEKHKKSKERDFRNNVESFLYDFKSQFQKATGDINTSSMSKFDKRRIGDKKLWQS